MDNPRWRSGASLRSSGSPTPREESMKRTTLLFALVAVFALAIGACGSDSDSDSSSDDSTTTTTAADDSGTTTTTAAGGGDNCTEDAIKSGIESGLESGTQLFSVDDYQCVDNYAAADATVGSTEVDSVDETFVLELSGSTWSTGDRETLCAGNALPPSLKTAACDSN